MSARELQECMTILKKIRYKCKKEGVDIDKKIIDSLSASEDGNHVLGKKFSEIIQKRLG